VVSEGLAVQSKWAAFTEQVASAIGVIINPMTRDCGEVKCNSCGLGDIDFVVFYHDRQQQNIVLAS
jgi:hypothetical protein